MGNPFDTHIHKHACMHVRSHARARIRTGGERCVCVCIVYGFKAATLVLFECILSGSQECWYAFVNQCHFSAYTSLLHCTLWCAYTCVLTQICRVEHRCHEGCENNDI